MKTLLALAALALSSVALAKNPYLLAKSAFWSDTVVLAQTKSLLDQGYVEKEPTTIVLKHSVKKGSLPDSGAYEILVAQPFTLETDAELSSVSVVGVAKISENGSVKFKALETK